MPSVLIVDDAAFMRTMLRGILSKAGYDVVGEAEDGLGAVTRHRQLRPDLTTMDIVMPGLDGLAALREIRGEVPDARVIMCSALGQHEMVIQCVEAGARDFIVKPFQPDRLIDAAERALL